MSRMLVDLPTDIIYRTTYKVVYSDINAANHLGADRILPIALEAQFGFVRSLGYEDAIVFENAGLIMANSQIDYISEVTYGASLNVGLEVQIVSKKSMAFIYSITDANSTIEVARVKTLLLCFDYATKKVVSIPEGFRQKLHALRQRSNTDQ